MSKNLITDFKERGLIHQTTDANSLHDWLATPGRRIYAGFDPTADSLHVGHLVAIILLRRVARAGHEPIALIGGATGMIGDPSGRSEERNLLSHEALAANIAAVGNQIKGLLESTNQTIHIVNNVDWMRGVGYLEFLRDVGKHVPLSQMLAKDSVKSRLDREGGLSYTEFSYMLLQSWDFVHLADEYDCCVQIGGSDQWGNITAGIELGRRLRGFDLHGITCPLLTKADGSKMGKTAKGAVWLSNEILSPYEYWQFWRNTADGDVGRFLRLFTELSLEEIIKLEALKDAELNEAKKLLATEATTLCHGKKAAINAANSAYQTFEEGGIGNNLPETVLSIETLSMGVQLLDLLVGPTYGLQLAKSKGEARRLIRGGGIRINDQQVTDEARVVTNKDLNKERLIKLSAGKKRHALVKQK